MGLLIFLCCRCLLSQLSACRRYVPSARFADGRCVVGIKQDFLKSSHLCIIGSFELATRKGIKRDEVYLALDPSQQFYKPLRIFHSIIYPPEHHIFNGNPASWFKWEALTGSQEILDRIAFIHGHDCITHLVSRCV